MPIQYIIEFCNGTLEETATPDENFPDVCENSSDTAAESQMTVDTEHENGSDNIVTSEAIDVACSIVKSFLVQICMQSFLCKMQFAI